MKLKLKLLTLAVLLSTVNHQFSTCFAQGSLTPPGPPAATMKSLDQIEARTPITNTSSLVTISQPGSYYLTHNLTVSTGDAIHINANGVTLDLNGFTISSTASSATGTGILLNNGLSDITIANGHIRGGVTNNGSGVYSGSGFANGIYYSGTSPANVLVSRVSVSGCQYFGIYISTGDSTVVESCTVRTVGDFGIYASTIKSCSAIDCGGDAILGDQVSDCRGQSSGASYGIVVTTSAQNCYGYSISGPGLSAYTAQNCYGSSSGNGDGLNADAAQNCYGVSSNGKGVSATTAENCYGFSGHSDGLNVTTANNCYGYNFSSDGYGLIADNANNCYGESSGGTGMYVYTSATDCHGKSGGSNDGLYTKLAYNCFGESVSGTGLYATSIAIGCNGVSSSGTGLDTVIANSCSGTSVIYTYHYNMPPP